MWIRATLTTLQGRIQDFLKGGFQGPERQVRRNFQTDKQKEKKIMGGGCLGSPKRGTRFNFHTENPKKKPKGGGG